MKLSIIIPVYNIEKYVARCLESILNQDFKDFEIIIINDGSTDESLIICELYSKSENRIRIFSQENSGVSIARNKGIEVSRGDWICFIDGDDFIEEGSLSKIIINNELINDSDCIIAKSFINNGNVIGKEKYPYEESFLNRKFNGLRLAIDFGYFRGSIWSVFYNRNFILSNNIHFPEGIKNGEDAIFFSEVLIYAKNIIFSNVHFYNIYEREGSASRTWDFDRLIYMINNIFYIKKYISRNNDLSKEQINVLNYDLYRIISTIFNKLSDCFSFKNWINIYLKINKLLDEKIDVGNIKNSKSKIKLLNTSVFLFSISILFKNIKIKK